jgi:hypothetical protein
MMPFSFSPKDVVFLEGPKDVVGKNLDMFIIFVFFHSLSCYIQVSFSSVRSQI